MSKFNMKGKSKDIKYDREVMLGTMNSREVYRPWGSSRICLIIKLFVHIKCIFISLVYVSVYDHVYVHMCMSIHVCVEVRRTTLGYFLRCYLSFV